MFIGGIQAFIFALLTVLYFGMAGAGHGDHDESDAHEDDRATGSHGAGEKDEQEAALAH
jgi:F-type H+-transporting ATPase subunit a